MRAKLTHWIARLRVSHGLTQPELAKAVGCSHSTIQAIELGKLQLSEKLAQRINAYFATSSPELELVIELGSALDRRSPYLKTRVLIELPKDDTGGPDIPGKRKIIVRRQPYDENYSILLPNGSEEYVPPDKAERILRVYGVRDPDKILTHVWNFYNAILYVNDPTSSSYGK